MPKVSNPKMTVATHEPGPHEFVILSCGWGREFMGRIVPIGELRPVAVEVRHI